MRRQRILATTLLMLIATLAMTATGFAHRFERNAQSAELLSYLSLGGTLEEICGDNAPPHHLNATCEACLISSTILAPETGTGILFVLPPARSARFSSTPYVGRFATLKGTGHARAPPFRAMA
ncbi:hypothetical protein ROLI_010240 [Roseobacter fucihabitans]|uniref:DUF2946 domain-containing protein n=1 Tax=Roseobacter fucihabitans TaxID=1537242 RepID=A0ABZ2BSX1_9RHOB|nr:hypothetical protein [Roseobacter litoralis]MBC6965486.1 hypothetical protein [Roseobacter litoralis]